MSKIDEVRTKEQAEIEDVIARLAYCGDNRYNTYDSIGSVCRDAMILINRLNFDIATLHNTVAIAQREAAEAQKERDAALMELKQLEQD